MAHEPNPTQESLLDAAINLFSSRGYAAVGIREIAEAAGANIASIKYHFGSKNKLYLAAVRRVMSRNRGDIAWALLEDPPDDPVLAGERLVRFIRLFLRHLNPPGSTVESSSSLMIREALSPSDAIDTVVRDYIEPNNLSLLGVLSKLAPDASPTELVHLSGCVLGQVLHIRVFRPFVERLREVDLSDASILDSIAFTIAEFSLRGLGKDESFIQAVMEAARADELELVKEGPS